MDSRGAARLADPSGGVERLAEATGASFPHLEQARARTSASVTKVAEALANVVPRVGISTCVFGSWARAELTDGSDDDWAVLVDHEFAAYDAAVLAEIVAAQAVLGGDDHKPGAQGVFGGPISVPELVANVGLDADTNTNLTRRMLLLLESRELHGDVRLGAIGSVLDRYLNEGVKDYRPPRFLLNDVVRYWRTICVDFEGKAVGGAARDPKWATRNAKLRTSRKLLFAGGLVSVLLCHLHPAAAMPEFLSRWFDATPLDRLSTAFLYASGADKGLTDTGVRAVGAYDRWVALMADAEVRDELKAITFDTREQSDLWVQIRELGREFEDALSALLFSSTLGRLTRTYGLL